jgi:hypothetical protein
VGEPPAALREVGPALVDQPPIPEGSGGRPGRLLLCRRRVNRNRGADDESTVYPPITKSFAGHGTVNHSIKEYVRGSFWHTSTVESYFSILKRGLIGTYHHVSQQHLK